MNENPLSKYGLKPIKRLGQNFLIDQTILEKIISAADITPEDTIVEIGPGTGVLTFELANKAKQVIAVEKDKKLSEALTNELEAKEIKNVTLINDDIIKILKHKFPYLPVGRQILNQIQNSKYKLVANLPYYITSPIIRMFLENENKPQLMILTIQKEVALRICAETPQMSILSIMVQFYACPEIIDFVAKESFFPVPKVDSAIIKIIPKKIPEIDTEKFFSLVKAGFAHIRKILASNLSSKFQVPKSKFQAELQEIGFDENTRAENLSVNDWLKFYEIIKNSI
jgi:16S rRNA (adenine1518-N6/adenine1519-N6)-dimethyltransferase